MRIGFGLLACTWAITASAQVIVPRSQGTVLLPATRPGATPATQPAAPRTASPQPAPLQQPATPITRSSNAPVQTLAAADQVVCQGFADGGQFATGRYGSFGTTHEIYILYAPMVPTRGAANNDASGLLPGTCAYIDKPWPTAGAAMAEALTLKIPQPGAYESLQEILNALRTPDRYWRFFMVRNEQNGNYEANRFEEWRPARPEAAASSCPEPNAGGQCVDQSRQALVGGRVMDPGMVEAQGLVGMTMSTSKGGASCSGSLLRNRWVLTAAHCIEDETSTGAVVNLAPNMVTATASWGPQTRTAVAIHSFRPLDVALIELDRPVTIQGATHGFNLPVWRDGSYRNLAQYPITFMGTGISRFASDNRNSAGVLLSQSPSSSDNRYRAGSAVIRRIEGNFMWFMDEANATGAGGDSGGPSYAGDAVSRGIIGVHSKCRLECAEGKICGHWPGPGPEPTDYNRWRWVTKTTACADAPLEPAWPQIERILAERTAPEAPAMQVTPLPYGAVRYRHPTTTGEDGKRHYADGCVHFGSDCDGSTAALYFCRTQDRAKARPVAFSLRQNVGASAIIRAEQADAGRVCFGPGCGAFDQITCAGPEYDLANLDTRVPNPAGVAVASESRVQAGTTAIAARPLGASTQGALTPRTTPAIVESTSGRSAASDSRAATPIQGTARNAGDGLVVGRLSDVRVITGIGEVGFQFTARPNAAPSIQISTAAPTIGSDGLQTMRNSQRMRADRDNRNSSDRVTRYLGASRPQGLTLGHGVDYHYLITVPPEGAGRAQQVSGTFVTPPRTVDVKFDRFRLLDRADLARFDLVLELNPKEAVTNRASWTNADWEPGALRRLNREIAVSGDIRRLRLVVTGRAHGSDGMECFSGTPSVAADPEGYFNGDTRYVDHCANVNVVKVEYPLDTGALSIPGRSVPFTLRAEGGQTATGRVRTSFEISGTITVPPP